MYIFLQSLCVYIHRIGADGRPWWASHFIDIRALSVDVRIVWFHSLHALINTEDFHTLINIPGNDRKSQVVIWSTETPGVWFISHKRHSH